MRTDHVRWVEEPNWDDAVPETKPGSGRLKLDPYPEILTPPPGLSDVTNVLGPIEDWTLPQNAETAPEWFPPKPPVPVIDLPLERRERVMFFLAAAAEIEHALMVQYLYAAYSVNPQAEFLSSDEKKVVTEIQNELLQIAREEMGHLMTVQNLLRVIGAPLTLSRGDGPFNSTLLPFRFRLEKLSLGSLAKYVTAERPIKLPDDFPNDDRWTARKIYWQAAYANDGIPVKQVGGLFSDILWMIKHKLKPSDFRSDSQEFQGAEQDWGFDATHEKLTPKTSGERLIVERFPGSDHGEILDQVYAAVHAISEQGEGWDASDDEEESHFERFFNLHQQFEPIVKAHGGRSPVHHVADNPNTTGVRGHSDDDFRCSVMKTMEITKSKNRIVNPAARALARFANIRYRMLLNHLMHFLLLDGPRYVEGIDAGDDLGARTARGYLLLWTFDEMRRLRYLSYALSQLPLDGDSATRAGVPFELPYTLTLPDQDRDRWWTHASVADAAIAQNEEELKLGELDGLNGITLPDGVDLKVFLHDVFEADTKKSATNLALAHGRPLPPPPKDFARVVQSLEEAMRGFAPQFHGSFWRGKTRDEFVSGFGSSTVNGTPDPAPDNWKLVRALERLEETRMPAGRPAVPTARREYLRDWIAKGAPDNVPNGAIGVRGEGQPSETPSGPTGESPEELLVDLLRKKRNNGAINPSHAGVSVGQSNLLNLFQDEDYGAILNFLKTGDSSQGTPLVVPGKPEESDFVRIITVGGMQFFFDQNTEVPIVEDWIMSLADE